MTIPVRKSKKAKRMSLLVHSDGRAELVIPFKYKPSQEYIDQFLFKYKNWIETQIARQKALPQKKALTHVGIPMQIVKRNTRELVSSYIASVEESYQIKTISLRSYKSQWGSCSSSGKIGFNYKLSLLPQPLAYYIIAHELSHLAHMNHSRRFWCAVERLCPDHKACRKALRKYLP